MSRALLGLSLLLVCHITQAAKVLAPEEMERLILGTWKEEIRSDGVFVSGTSSYTPDSKVVHVGSMVAQGQELKFYFESRWRIEGNVLITEVLKSSFPEGVPAGSIERDTILSMSQDQWTYRDSDGMEVTAIRVSTD